MKSLSLAVVFVVLAASAVLLFSWRGERSAKVAEPTEEQGSTRVAQPAVELVTASAEAAVRVEAAPSERELGAGVSSPERPEALATLSGCVIDEQGVPVEGATLRLHYRTRSRAGREVRHDRKSTNSDAEGRFRFEQLAQREWNLEVADEELLEGIEQTVDLCAGSRELELVGKRGHVLLVRARWEDGTLAELSSLGVGYATGHMGVGLGPSNVRDGLCRVVGLPAGEMEVRARAERYGRAGSGVAKVLVPDTEVCDVLLLETTTVVVRGTVRDLDGEPVSGVQVLLTAIERQQHAMAESAADGTFEMQAIEPGPAELRVLSIEHYWPEARTGRKLELVPGMAPLELVLEPMAVVRGHVLDETGTPLAGASVFGGHGSTETEEDGNFELTLEPGKRILYATAPGHARSANEEVLVESRRALEGVELRLRSACRVAGRVFDAEGQPMPAATVFAGPGQRETDEHGEFLFDALPPGPVVLQAIDDDDGFARQSVVAVVGSELRVELRFLPRAPVSVRLELREHGQPLEVEMQLHTLGFFRVGDSREARLELVLQTPGLWRGVLRRAGVADDDYSAKRLFELDVPAGEPFEATLELDDLSAPAVAADITAWLGG